MFVFPQNTILRYSRLQIRATNRPAFARIRRGRLALSSSELEVSLELGAWILELPFIPPHLQLAPRPAALASAPFSLAPLGSAENPTNSIPTDDPSSRDETKCPVAGKSFPHPHCAPRVCAGIRRERNPDPNTNHAHSRYREITSHCENQTSV